ncbi:MAG: hypothetical protein LBT25_01110 [Candidatus Symbiothrix sp.]|nr:hypothetical protein [Candidatus Symbiothrix sp.]
MSTLELEAKKAELAREILSETDKNKTKMKIVCSDDFKKHRTTKERLIEFYGEASVGTAQDDSQTETNWGKPLGKEVW